MSERGAIMVPIQIAVDEEVITRHMHDDKRKDVRLPRPGFLLIVDPEV